MERLNTNRSYWLALFLGFVPFGWIYTLWFFYDAIKGLNIACGAVEKEEYESKKSPGFILFLVLTIITFSIYELYWLWKQGKRMTEAGEKYGIKEQFLDPERQKFTTIVICIIASVVSALCCFFVPPLLLVCLACWIISGFAFNTFFKDLNLLCGAYNNQIIDGNKPQEHVNELPGLENKGNNVPGIEMKTDDGPKNFDTEWKREEKERKERERILREMEEKRRKEEEERRRREEEEAKRKFQAKRGGIMMVSGEYAGSKIQLADGEKVMIGRDPKKCSLVCSSDKVSRTHLEIKCEQSREGQVRYIVTDHSTNGTYSSESGILPPKKPVYQKVGTVLELGRSEESIRLL